MSNTQLERTFVLDELLAVKPGEPFRLLPFGPLVKNGRKREITPEMARRFRLPHFRPPIKLGSHEERTAAGGHIVGLEVREDGLWAIAEFNEEGARALAQGAYRYHSPEILWEGSLEDPATGDPIEGPLIVGDALLHMPHLGEMAALYSVEMTEGVNRMSNETVQVPASVWERIMDWLSPRAPEPANTPEPEPVVLDAGVKADEFAAVVAERDDLAAKVQAMEAQARRGERVAAYAAELHGTTLDGDEELTGLLADLDPAIADKLMQRVKALTEQARVAALTETPGHSGESATGDPTAALDAAVRERMAKTGENYGMALLGVGRERPDLITAYGGK